MIRSFLAHPAGDAVAIGTGVTRTAADLLGDSSRVARALAAYPPGEILLVCDDRYLFTAALLGAWSAGHVVLLPPNAQPDTLRALASGPDVRVFLDDRGGAGGGTDIRPMLAGPGGMRPLPAIAPERLLVVLSTSGTTGSHQRSPKSAAQVLGEAATLARTFAIPPGARILASVPPHHIYGLLFGVLMPLRAGGAFVRETPLQPEAVAAALARAGATHFVSVPAHLRLLSGADAMPPVQRVFSSGAPLPAATARALSERFAWRTTEVFGSTETGGIAWRDHPLDAWQPFPGVTATAGPGEQLLLDSPLLPVDTPRPFACADRIALRPGGAFDLLGRTDGVVKVAGKRVSIREIEERLLTVPGVQDAAAMTVRVDGARGEEVWAAVVAPGCRADALRHALTAWIDPVAVPRRMEIVERLPREDTGKLRADRLRALFEAARTPAAPLRDLDPDSETCHTDSAGRDVRRLDVTVSPDLIYFRGHFDGVPVLPGIVQLELLVLRQARRIWPDLGGVETVNRLKFKRIISPGARLALTLTRPKGEPRIDFEIESGKGSCSSGSISFRASDQP